MTVARVLRKLNDDRIVLQTQATRSDLIHEVEIEVEHTSPKTAPQSAMRKFESCRSGRKSVP